MDSHKRKNTSEAENSIDLSTENKNKKQPADEFIFGSDVAEAKVITNCYPIRSEIFLLCLLLLYQKAKR